MKKLLLSLLFASFLMAQPPATFTGGQRLLASQLNTAFQGLYTGKVGRWTGSGAPGDFAFSLIGDLYYNTASPGSVYGCYRVHCTAVGTNNWVLISGGGGGNCTVAGSTNVLQKNSGSSNCAASTITDNGSTVTTTLPMQAPSFIGTDTTHSAASVYSGKTSGAVAFAAADVAGPAITYIWPTTNGTAGQSLKDNGATTCPTLAAGVPAVCHQLIWQ